MLKEINLHDYQQTAVSHIMEVPKCGLFLDMGLGKTVSTLTAINKLLYEEFAVSKVLIVAPKRVAESVWSDEIEKWEHLRHLTISKIIGSEKKRITALKSKADIYIIGRDNIVWLTAQYGGGMLPFDMLVIDESSSFKNPKSQRFKALRHVMQCFERVVLLTGTPAPNGYMDLWSQIYLIDRGERLGKFITHYRERFFSPGQRNGAVIFNYNIKKDGVSAINDRISDICISMKTEDYLHNLPSRHSNFIKVPLSDEAQKAYNKFEKDQVLQLFNTSEDSDEITAVNAAALSNKLLQYANGAIYDDDHNVHEVHKAKLEALAEIIEANEGKPILVAYTYKHDRDRILEKFKKYKPEVLKDNDTIKRWNEGKIRILCMHPASGGHGLNLQAGGNIVVWFGQTWNLEHYQQLNKRLHRQGQKNEVIIHHLVAHNTIDQDVVKALEGKGRTQDDLMQSIKAKIRKYIK